MKYLQAAIEESSPCFHPTASACHMMTKYININIYVWVSWSVSNWKRQPGSIFSAALYFQSFNSFAFSGSDQIWNILETLKVFSAFLWFFCYLSFCLKNISRSVKNLLHSTIQKPYGNLSIRKKIYITQIHWENVHPNNGVITLSSPLSKRNAGIKITSVLGKPRNMCMCPLHTQHIISR